MAALADAEDVANERGNSAALAPARLISAKVFFVITTIFRWVSKTSEREREKCARWNKSMYRG